MESNIELNNCISLGLEKINTPVKNICILGNTAGMFGKFPGNENNWNDKNFVNCITFIVNNINENFVIIGDEFVFKYYNTMFCWLKQINIIQKKVAVNTIDINNKKYKGNYIECLKDINKNNMNFDVVIMNPPYGKYHLPILENAIKIADNVISIQPIRWMSDITAKYSNRSDYNKYENSILKHIKSLEIVKDSDAETLFGAGFTMDLGIYVCDKNGGFDYTSRVTDRIFDNVVSKITDTVKKHLEFSVPKNAITVSLITGGNKGRKSNLIDLYYTFAKDGSDSTYTNVVYDKNGKRLDNGLTFYENRKLTAWGNVKVRAEQNNIKFDSVEQCINFYNFTKLDLFRYLFNKSVVDVHVHPEYLPFIGDYSTPWTNEMLYDYFNISKEDRIYISEYIKNEYNELKKQRFNA